MINLSMFVEFWGLNSHFLFLVHQSSGSKLLETGWNRCYMLLHPPEFAWEEKSRLGTKETDEKTPLQNESRSKEIKKEKVVVHEVYHGRAIYSVPTSWPLLDLVRFMTWTFCVNPFRLRAILLPEFLSNLLGLGVLVLPIVETCFWPSLVYFIVLCPPRVEILETS